jgi:hypothetical protein
MSLLGSHKIVSWMCWELGPFQLFGRYGLHLDVQPIKVVHTDMGTCLASLNVLPSMQLAIFSAVSHLPNLAALPLLPLVSQRRLRALPKIQESTDAEEQKQIR